jgi:predicted nucleotidyltransferase
MTLALVSELVESFRVEAQAISPAPTALILFGSTARNEAQWDSDVDVLVVRPAGIEFDDDAWTDALIEWRHSVGKITSRSVELIEAGENEVPGLLARPGSTVWRAIADEGVVVTGRALSELGGPSLLG